MTFAAIAEDFIAEKLPSESKGYEVARDIRRVFIPLWGKRPAADITALDVRTVIRAVKAEGKTYQAHNLLGYVRRLYNWAINQHAYGIETSPCDRLESESIVGARPPRTRILNDAELRAAWQATDKLGYPYGALYRLLMLTGARRSEVSEAVWSEFDLTKKLWSIPPERTKTGAAHVVPVSDDAMAVLTSLPRFKRGNHLFSATHGVKSAHSHDKAKGRLDAEMAKLIGDFPDFIIHDLRRTVRTQLSAIPGISDLVRELVIGHTKPGLHKVYDQFAYLDEKRFALNAWASRLRSIVEPPPANVVELAARQ